MQLFYVVAFGRSCRRSGGKAEHLHDIEPPTHIYSHASGTFSEFPVRIPRNRTMAHNAVTLDDSPFSITGNVVGILTFLLGLFASYIALHTLARDSEEELIEFLDDVWNTSDQIQEVIRIARRAGELDLATFADSTFLRKSLGLTENLLSKLLKELTSGSTFMKGQQHLPRSRPPRKTYLFDFRLRRRIVWIFSRTRLLAEMRRLEALKADVYMAQNGYLSE